MKQSATTTAQGRYAGKKYSKREYQAFLYLLPWLIGLFGLQLYPLFRSPYQSFTEFNMDEQNLSILKDRSAGIHLRRLVSDPIAEQPCHFINRQFCSLRHHFSGNFPDTLITFFVKFIFAIPQSSLGQALQFFCPLNNSVRHCSPQRIYCIFFASH